MRQHDLSLPDLGLGDRPVVAGLWLVGLGNRVEEGDQLLEVSADAVVIDIPAPVGGTLVELLVSEDEPIKAGQPLAIIETDEDDF
jgi:pyruvate/2-oxoglutarate dehydrogenase complex dihydrolipoamide acyltransferase (E2) component